VSGHVGLKTRIANIIHSIKADSGRKYDRYFCIAYLPKRNGLGSCLAMGCLEVEREGEKEFFNPSKFYDVATLEEAVAHVLAAYVAFKAIKTGRDLPSTMNSTITNIYSNKRYREKLANLATSYYSSMLRMERGENTGIEDHEERPRGQEE